MTHRTLPRALPLLLLSASLRLPAQQASLQPPSVLNDAPPVSALRPGDRVIVRLPGEMTLPDSLQVDERGIVTLPRVGPIDVSKFEPEQAADSIRARFRKAFANNDITVLLRRRVTVFGEVNKPGVIYLETTATIRDAIATASGATPVADIGHVDLVRDGVLEHIPDWTTATANSRPLRSGDAIMMGRESWVRRNVGSLLGAIGILASVIVAVTR